MKQETFDEFDENLLKFRSVTTSMFTCPHCRKPVKFVVEDGSNLKRLDVELEHYKKLANSLAKDNYDLKMFCKRLASQL